MIKRRVEIGERVTIRLPYSEVCMHMAVAGRPFEVELAADDSAQIYKDGRKFSFPILPSEAGFYRDETGWYTYVE